jgi:uncharacterized protein YndB with AHSA1/START domain
MLIRRPVAEVFDAFVDPAVTTKFWFTKSSGRLEAGKRVTWEWEMYGAAAEVNVQTIEANKRIVIEWGHSPTTVEWIFMPLGNDHTFVSITNYDFQGDTDSQINEAIQSTEEFTLVLAGLKALMEHGIQLNLVRDRFPPGTLER